MESKKKFKKLKNRIINKFSEISDCDIEFEEFLSRYELKCKHPDVNSFIIIGIPDVLKGIIEIEFKDLYYYGEIMIDDDELIKEFVFRISHCKSFSEYLSLIKSLTEHFTLIEYIRQTLFEDEKDVLEIKIFGDGDIRLIYSHTENDDKTYSNIEISGNVKYLSLKVVRPTGQIDKMFINMKTVPKALKSAIRYALNISSPKEYLKLEYAIQKLAELIEVRKYLVEDAIRELVEMYDYGDIFDL